MRQSLLLGTFILAAALAAPAQAAVITVQKPIGDAEEARKEYGIELQDLSRFTDLDCVIVAVPHAGVKELFPRLASMLKANAVIIDIKSALKKEDFTEYTYWAL